MKKKAAILLALLLTFTLTTNVFAQDYYFSLDKMVVHVYWNADGTSSLDYLLTFTNQPGGHPIEYVDVGMPNGNFDFNSIQASINGNPLSISRDFQGTGDGFAVEMGRYAIPPGGTGTVRVFVGRVSGVLYKDDNDGEYVSAVFSPLYFQRSVITGNTDITVVYHLPPGVQPDEPRWHSAPSGFPGEPRTGFDAEGRITYTWTNPNANGYTRYEFGASFPKSYVPADSIVTVQLPSLSVSSDAIFNLLCIGIFGFMFLGIPVLTAIAGNRRKLQYMPPKISIEGHGIKRGLTAVEAAILMEQPLDKVMTMILFGVVKKGAAQVIKRDPLQIQIVEPLPEGLHEYEKDFLAAFRPGNTKSRRKDLQDMTVKLVRSVSEKMKGFSRRETLEYYKAIMEKAWRQVEEADTPEVKSQLFDETLEWTMLDKDYDTRTRRVFTGPVFVPVWWHRFDPGWSGGTRTASAPSMPSVGKGSTALPGADFAASVVGGVQTFSQKVIGNVGDFTSRVTNLTNPLPKTGTTGGRSGGGGGRSCACACACAGCACACAGGGR